MKYLGWVDIRETIVKASLKPIYEYVSSSAHLKSLVLGDDTCEDGSHLEGFLEAVAQNQNLREIRVMALTTVAAFVDMLLKTKSIEDLDMSQFVELSYD